MLKLNEIKELIALLDKSSLEHFEYEKDGNKLLLKKSSTAFYEMTRGIEAPSQSFQHFMPVTEPIAVHEVASNNQAQNEAVPAIGKCEVKQILSPMVGTFYEAPSPDKGPFVAIGDRVSEKKIVCIIEAMKLFNEIEAEVSGEITEIHVKNGQLIEFGQPLFTVKVE